MPEELQKIDTSALDKLASINEQLQRLLEYCDKAESLKSDVEPAVFQRVLADYNHRRASLEEQATPLKSEARASFVELGELHTSFKHSLDEALLEKQELEFRCKVGEINEKELKQQLRESEEALAERKRDFGEVEALHKRFLDALGSDTDGSGASDLDLDKTVLAPESAPASASQGTTAAATLADTAPNPALSPSASEDKGKTVLVPRAVVVADSEGTEAKEFSLGTTNYIGSNDDNQIPVASRGVSRRHALITAGLEGFAIKDLKSRNGTLVNGERVKERALADGDRITIGEMSLVFRVL